MSSQSEARQLARQLRKEGFEVSTTGSGHWEVRYLGRRIVTFARTPGDHRWRSNTTAQIRRWKRRQQPALMDALAPKG